MKKNDNLFDPNGPGLDNGNLYGLPHTKESAALWVIPVPWDTTVSYRAGTAKGPEAILESSLQVEVFDADLEEAWKPGMAMLDFPERLEKLNGSSRIKAKQIMDALERGGELPDHQIVLKDVNDACEQMCEWVAKQADEAIIHSKIPMVLGGDHSTPLGLIKALSKRYRDFGILQVDAHMDLRNAYEGFTYSHASIMWNAIQLPEVKRLIQVGVRDYCEEEVEVMVNQKDRIRAFSFREMEKKRFNGVSWREQVEEMIAELPSKVYISFDIDGLDPDLCPDTGTPVPGGLSFEEALFLIDSIATSGREIIGFDLCEVAPGKNEWNAIVGGRVLYRLYVSAIKSQANKK